MTVSSGSQDKPMRLASIRVAALPDVPLVLRSPSPITPVRNYSTQQNYESSAQRKNVSSNNLTPIKSSYEPIQGVGSSQNLQFKEIQVRPRKGAKRRISVPLMAVANPVEHLQRLNKYDSTMKKRRG